MGRQKDNSIKEREIKNFMYLKFHRAMMET